MTHSVEHSNYREKKNPGLVLQFTYYIKTINSHRITKWLGLEGAINTILLQPLCHWQRHLLPGYSEPHSTWPWTLPTMEHPHFLWETCSSASPPSHGKISSHIFYKSTHFQPLPLITVSWGYKLNSPFPSDITSHWFFHYLFVSVVAAASRVYLLFSSIRHQLLSWKCQTTFLINVRLCWYSPGKQNDKDFPWW